MKVSIPKADIDRIMADYNCTQEEATKAYLKAASAANEVFQETIAQNLKKDAIYNIPVYTPKQIKDHLDKYVIGQEEYKKRISIAAAYHFAMVKYLHEHTEEERKVKRFRKKNTLISGPSGSGKTYCIEVLGDYLQIPTLIVDATDYTEMGYVGKSSEDMIRELIDMAPGSNKKEQAEFVAKNGGIIFIDELDKKAKESYNGWSGGHDIAREGFQRSVLKILERKSVLIENPYSPVSQIQEAMELQQGKTDKKEKMISTENILFILGGSFERNVESLETIVKRRILQNLPDDEENMRIINGFGTSQSEELERSYKSYHKEATVNDYIKFGLLPELVGRTPIRTFVNRLSKNDLIRIMEDTEDSIITQYKVEFQLFDIKLEVTSDAINYIAEEADSKKTGARALVSVLESILTEYQFQLPGTNFKTLVVDEELCRHPSDNILKLFERSPFVDYVQTFKLSYGIQLILGEGVQEYVKQYAKEHNQEITKSLRELLKGAVSLNYMNFQGTFEVTVPMLEDKKYFDNLFLDWWNSQPHK
ncbi:MAG TPA: AAA family ATPase [Planctomycetota bacterium]|nr:AAA family ATPase [Planctomycetota bacterium]HRU51031.1 AAA family ATPase [Planctomycetota bacterium]